MMRKINEIFTVYRVKAITQVLRQSSSVSPDAT